MSKLRKIRKQHRKSAFAHEFWSRLGFETAVMRQINPQDRQKLNIPNRIKIMPYEALNQAF